MYELELPPDCQVIIQDLHCYGCSLSFSDLRAFKMHRHTPNPKLKPPSSAFAIWNSSSNLQTRKSTGRNLHNQIETQEQKQVEQNASKKEESSSSSLALQNIPSKCIEGEDEIQVYCTKCFGTFQSLTKFLSHLGRHSNNNNNYQLQQNQPPPSSPIVMQQQQQRPLGNRNTCDNININSNLDSGISKLKNQNQKLKSVSISKNVSVSSPAKKIVPPSSSTSTLKPKPILKTKPSPVKENSIDNKVPKVDDEPPPEIDIQIKREEIEGSDLDLDLDFDVDMNLDLGPNYEIDMPSPLEQGQDSPPPPPLSPAHLNDDDNVVDDDNNNNNNNSDEEDEDEINDKDKNNNNNESDDDFIPDDPDDSDDSDYEMNTRKRRRTFTSSTAEIDRYRDRVYIGNSKDGFECEYKNCTKKFKSRSKLQIHEGTHRGFKRYECQFPGCGKKFASSTPMYRHRVIVHGLGKLKNKCEWNGCTKMFFTPSEMKKHLRGHQKSNPNPNNVDKSIPAENQIVRIDQEEAARRKRKRDDKNRHQKIHTRILIISCKFPGCIRKFKCRRLLKRHKAVSHGIGEKKYKCDVEYCNKDFFQPFELRKHAKTHANDPKEPNFPCTFDGCPASFVLEKYRTMHINTVHRVHRRLLEPVVLEPDEQEEEEWVDLSGIEAESESDFGNFQCKKCFIRFKTEGELNHHQLLIHNKDSLGKHGCHYCEKTYRSATHRNRHHAVAHGKGELKHKCGYENCDKKFYTFSEMKRHLQTHGNVAVVVPGSTAVLVPNEKLLCTLCGKQYSSNFQLQTHIQRVHEGVRKYLCPHCGRTFSDQGGYARHLLIHTGERPFACKFEGCVKRFRQIGALQDHMNIHKGVKNNVCSYCGMAFTQRFTLVRHLQTHTGIKPYKCDFPDCGAEFPDLRPLKKHKLTHLEEKEEGE